MSACFRPFGIPLAEENHPFHSSQHLVLRGARQLTPPKWLNTVNTQRLAQLTLLQNASLPKQLPSARLCHKIKSIDSRVRTSPWNNTCPDSPGQKDYLTMAATQMRRQTWQNLDHWDISVAIFGEVVLNILFYEGPTGLGAIGKLDELLPAGEKLHTLFHSVLCA